VIQQYYELCCKLQRDTRVRANPNRCFNVWHFNHSPFHTKVRLTVSPTGSSSFMALLQPKLSLKVAQRQSDSGLMQMVSVLRSISSS